MTTKNFVQIPNVAFAFGTEYKLNNDEIKVLANLQFMRNVGTMQIRTHVTIIVEDLGWATSKSSRDNTRVANALEGLEDKGYIQMAFNKEIKKDALEIQITIDGLKKSEALSKVEWKENPFKFSGYTEIQVGEYNLAGEDDYNLTVLAYHKWRANLGKTTDFVYAIADKEWALVLELSGKHSRAIIDDCDFLTKISGSKFVDENGQWRQETNQYVKTVQTKLSEIESKNKNMTILEKEMEKVTDVDVMTDSETFHQIFDKDTPMVSKGYKAWKETTCDHVKQAGQKKYDSVVNSPKEGAKYIVAKWEREYAKHLSYLKEQEVNKIKMDKFSESQIQSVKDEEAHQKKQAEIREKKRQKDKEKQFIFDDY